MSLLLDMFNAYIRYVQNESRSHNSLNLFEFLFRFIMRVQKAHRTTKLSSLSQSTLEYFVRKDEETGDNPLLSGITKGSSYHVV